MNNPKFQIFKSVSNGNYYYRLRARNGEPILSSEGYTSKQSCIAGIAAVKTNASYEQRYRRSNGIINYTFNLLGGNGEIIGRSENYSTIEARENGIRAVKLDAPNAPIEDLT